MEGSSPLRVHPGASRGVPTSSPPSPPNRVTPGPSGPLKPSPKPLKRSPLASPSSPTHWVSPGTAFRASHHSLRTRAGVGSRGWKVKARTLSQLLPAAPPSRKSWGGAGPPPPPGTFPGTPEGRAAVGAVEVALGRKKGQLSSRAEVGVGSLGWRGSPIQRWAQSWRKATMVRAADSRADQVV